MRSEVGDDPEPAIDRIQSLAEIVGDPAEEKIMGWRSRRDTVAPSPQQVAIEDEWARGHRSRHNPAIATSAAAFV
jgi:hypothetical protein